MSFVALPAKVRIVVANNARTVIKAIYGDIENDTLAAAITDIRQLEILPAMGHPAAVFGDSIFIDFKTTDTGLDGLDAGLAVIRVPIRANVGGRIEPRNLNGNDFSIADIASGGLPNGTWTQAMKYAIIAGEQVKLGRPEVFNSRLNIRGPDDTST